MSTNNEVALRLALEALERVNNVDDDCDILSPELANFVVDTIDVLKEALANEDADAEIIKYHEATIARLQEALAKQEQGEPVAWMTTEANTGVQVWLYKKTAVRYQNPPTPLYTTPQQRKPLTREVIDRDFHGRVDFVRQVEAAHDIKGEE